MDKEENQELAADPLHEIKERYKTAKENWQKNQSRYLEDVKFLAGEQWDEEIKRDREARSEPVLTVDKLNQYVRQIVNDSRQNKPAIKAHPVDSGADVETAEIIQGLIRHIEYASDAQAAYDTAEECAVKGGFGFIRVLTDYANPNTFEQDICIHRVRNPLTVLTDPDRTKADFSDIRYAFFIDSMKEDEFKEKYKDIDFKDFEASDLMYKTDEDDIIVAEYWEVRTEMVTKHLLESGDVATDEEIEMAKKEGIEIPAILDTREMENNTVWYSKVCGAGYLEKPKKWIGKYIPLAVVIGNEIDIEGEVNYVGLINGAKDAQRLYNYSRSAFASRVALSPKAPYVAAAGQVEQYRTDWETANTENHSVLTYDPIDVNGTPLPPPRREQASDIPAGFSQDMQLSEHDIQAAVGMYAANLGQPSNEKSGRAIMARQREGDTGSFHYHDNLARAICHVGRIIVDLIPKVYDSKRVVRIIGTDDTAKLVQLDPTQEAAKQKHGSTTIYNLNVGKYDVTIEVGASYTTKRQETLDAMIEMTRGNPQLMGIVGDIMFRAMDFPLAKEISDRMKLMLPPQIQQAEQQNTELPPEAMQILETAKQEIAQRDQMLQQAEQMVQQLGQQMQVLQKQLADVSEKTRLESEKADMEQLYKIDELSIDLYRATTERIDILVKAGVDIQTATIQAMNSLETEKEATNREMGVALMSQAQPEQQPEQPMPQQMPQAQPQQQPQQQPLSFTPPASAGSAAIAGEQMPQE